VELQVKVDCVREKSPVVSLAVMHMVPGQDPAFQRFVMTVYSSLLTMMDWYQEVAPAAE